MIPTKSRRFKTPKLTKNLERLYKQAKCRDCIVKVTRMDFAKILGKFTKVKIKFESNSTIPKAKGAVLSAPSSRIKNNENGMVQIHRSAYNPHPARKLLGIPKKNKNNNNSSPRPNVLREINSLKKTEKDSDYEEKVLNSQLKHYGIVFKSPISKKKEVKSKICLDDLLPSINSDVLPSNEWCIDYFPKKGEPKDDKIYDRIAAELEDLMFNEKTKNNSDSKDEKNDEFPSILDILNDNSKEVAEKTSAPDTSTHIESNDVEAILLGKTKSTDPQPMDIDNTDGSNLLSGNDKPSTNDDKKNITTQETSSEDNPNSPSILEEKLREEVPVLSLAEKPSPVPAVDNPNASESIDENDNTNTKNKNNVKTSIGHVTQVIFKKTINGTSSKTVICPKNLKYSILIQGQTVELLGAPKVISSLEDLQVLLQIVDESELTSLHVLIN